ncbi:MAG TPA: hypothetical protein VFG59_15340 [Anaeromyxobacter sp.]|nr:hypothetical protein [Anaeromyxobacter sp.]
MGVGLLLAVPPAAWAQASQVGGEAVPGTSDAFEKACADLINGRPPAGGAKAADSLRGACNDLMGARAQAQREAEERAQTPQPPQGAAAGGTGAGARVEPGQGTEAPAQGGSVLSAFEQAGHELVGGSRGAPFGFKRSGGPFRYTLVTNPIGWFNGTGINAEAFGSLLPKISWVGGARFSSTDATNGSVNTFGVEAGMDYFLLGRNNEGLRVGPRLEVAFGRESFQTATTFGWMGLSGEVGYNFLASNGITGVVAAGLGGRIAGHRRENFASFTGGEFGPYGKVGIGYSW